MGKRSVTTADDASPTLRQSATLSKRTTSSASVESQAQVSVNAEPKQEVDVAAKNAALSLGALRKAIPEKAFVKSLPKSLFYMFFDYAMWIGSAILMKMLVESPVWATLPFAAKAAASVVYWNVAGFFMWCIFVVGHDCGHTTFSNYTLLNDILGHITHGSLLVPFYPWQLSHRRHHMYHNHIEKDYSYLWFTKEIMNKEDSWVARWFHRTPLVSFFFPFYGWFMYLMVGVKDGNHFIPFPNDRMWKESPIEEYFKCLLSAAVAIGYGYAYYNYFGQSVATMAFYYGAPWIMFGWWLVTVTYLQHHNEDPVVYDNDDFKFAEAGLETVDRKYGYGIDAMHHHISDCHVAHHLFFTQIPHYNLPVATEAIKNYLQEKKLSHLYKFEETFDFPLRVHSYVMKHGFKARRAYEAPLSAAK